MASGGCPSRKAESRAPLRSVQLRIQPEQEPQNDLVEELWPFHLRQMSRVRDNRQPGVRDCRGKGSSRLANVHDVLVAIDDQGWSGDLRQPLGGGRVEGELLAIDVVAGEERGV